MKYNGEGSFLADKSLYLEAENVRETGETGEKSTLIYSQLEEINSLTGLPGLTNPKTLSFGKAGCEAGLA